MRWPAELNRGHRLVVFVAFESVRARHLHENGGLGGDFLQLLKVESVVNLRLFNDLEAGLLQSHTLLLCGVQHLLDNPHLRVDTELQIVRQRKLFNMLCKAQMIDKVGHSVGAELREEHLSKVVADGYLDLVLLDKSLPLLLHLFARATQHQMCVVTIEVQVSERRRRLLSLAIEVHDKAL